MTKPVMMMKAQTQTGEVSMRQPMMKMRQALVTMTRMMVSMMMMCKWKRPTRVSRASGVPPPRGAAWVDVL